MAFEGIHRLPVVGASDQVVGLVSSLDVLRWLAQRSGYLVPRTTQQQRG
jgi:signal-transduction protein with cAMP-binding, CBS, and nucleotidyltransferase domain